MKKFVGEKRKINNTVKEVFFYYDHEKGISQLSREVYKKKDELAHYPRAFDGGPKYKNIKKIVYRGFRNKMPMGVYKTVNFGWGFTRPLRSFAKYIDEELKIKEIVIQKGGQASWTIASDKMYLSDADMSLLQRSLTAIFRKYKEEENVSLMNILHSFFPARIAKPDRSYLPNALATSLSTWGNSIDEFSEDDKDAIKELFEKLSLGTDFLTRQALAKTKEIIDSKYVQETLKQYDKLMQSSKETKTLEKKWQLFLKDNSWIFSSIFAQPVILHRAEAYVGGKNIDNQGGKVSDFLIKNSLSNNVSFLEIKTHKTLLTESKPYRGEEVFSCSKELTGSIVQVLNQRDLFQKEFTGFHYKNNSDSIETLNSKCIVLVGKAADLTAKQLNSFELFRSNSRDVDILTFDELQQKIRSLQQLIKDPATSLKEKQPSKRGKAKQATKKGPIRRRRNAK